MHGQRVLKTQENRYFGIWFLENIKKILNFLKKERHFFWLKYASSQPVSSLEK